MPFGTDMLFRSTGTVPVTFHVEICEDIWVPVPPSSHAALAGAEVLVNLSASNITIGKAEARRLLCGSQSARGIAAYAYSASGPGESTTDLAWDGHAAIYECGDQLVESPRFEKDSTIVRADVDLGRIRQERLRNNGFADCADAREPTKVARFRKVELRARRAARQRGPRPRRSSAFPTCRRIRPSCATIATRPTTSRSRAWRSACSRAATEQAIIGVSGGLDSTQALIVICRAMDQLGLPRKNVLAYTLPGFGTSDKTHKNAWRLMKALGVTAAEIDIKPAAKQMLADIGHPFAKGEKVYDVTFENVQAGLRTDYLFRLANQHQRHGGGHRRSLRAGAGLVHLRRRRSHVALQSQRLGFQDADPAPDPLRRRLGRRRQGDGRDPARHPRHRNLARADPGRRQAARSSRPSSRSGPMRCRISISST